MKRMNKTGFFYCKVFDVIVQTKYVPKRRPFLLKNMYAQQWPKRSDRIARAVFAKMFDLLDFTPEQTLYCSDELFLKIDMSSVEL